MPQPLSVTAGFTADKTSAKPGESIVFEASDPPQAEPDIVSVWGDPRIETVDGEEWQHEVQDSIRYTWRFENGAPDSASGSGPHTVTYGALGTHPATLIVKRVRRERRRRKRPASGNWGQWHTATFENVATDSTSRRIEISLESASVEEIFNPNVDPDGDSSTSLDRKYWRVFVPDFNGEDVGDPATSYIRLGAVETSVRRKWRKVNYERKAHAGSPPEPKFDDGTGTLIDAADAFPIESGEDLAALVMDFDDDYRDRNSHKEKADTRTNESSLLHTRGGWRDHTDGNRITTTRGDKVEVIAGNYKRIVLGRRPFDGGDVTSSANKWGDTLDVSGGVAMDIDQTPFATTDIRWDHDLKTWKVTESGLNGYYVSETQGLSINRFRGRQEEYTSGSSYSYHGSAGAKKGDPAGSHFAVSIPGLDLAWPDRVDSPFSPHGEEQKVVDVVDAESWNYHKGNLYERNVNELVDTQAFWGTQRGVDIGGVSSELEIAIAKVAVKVVPATLDMRIGSEVNMVLGQTMNLRCGTEMNVVTSASQDFSLDGTRISLKDTVVNMGRTLLCLKCSIN